MNSTRTRGILNVLVCAMKAIMLMFIIVEYNVMIPQISTRVRSPVAAVAHEARCGSI
jgi:hypothetical protein